jgi:hypothetical protein
MAADAANSFISVAGNVIYDNSLNRKGRSDVEIHGTTDFTNSAVTIGGSISINLANTTGLTGDNQGATKNQVGLGDSDGSNGTGFGLIVNGYTTIVGSNGQDEVFIEEAQLKLGASVLLNNNPTITPVKGALVLALDGVKGNDYLEIDGAAFGGGVTVVMSGPNAEIHINNGNGTQKTTFTGLFYAIMGGSKPLILVSTSTGSGFSPVAFNGAAIALGSPGAGGKFIYYAPNVTGTIIPIYFTLQMTTPIP